MTNQQLSQNMLEKLSKRELLNMIEHGKLIIMYKESKEDRPEWQKVKHLQGVGIHLSEAARKYSIPLGTISRWVKRGLISVIGYDGNKTILNEADVAYLKEIYKTRGGRGRRVFGDDGLPYIPKT